MWGWLAGAAAVVLVVGFVRGRARGLPLDAARELLKQGATVLDVRTPAEFGAGHAEGAVNLPLNKLSAEAARRFPDKTACLLVHCRSGVRSQQAMSILKGLGYTRIHNLGALERALELCRTSSERNG